jgi:hypothetical protein
MHRHPSHAKALHLPVVKRKKPISVSSEAFPSEKIVLEALLLDNLPCTCGTGLQLHHLSHCQWNSL